MEKLTTKDETDQLARLDLRMKEARTRFLFIIPQQLHMLAYLKTPSQDCPGIMIFTSDVNSYDQGLICHLHNLLVLSIIHVGTPSSFMLFANFGRSAISILLWGGFNILLPVRINLDYTGSF